MKSKKEKNNKVGEGDGYRGINLGSFFLGLLIVIVGFSYLAEQIGIVSVNVDFLISHFWSLLIIWIGFSLLGRRDRRVELAGIVLASALLLLTSLAIFNPPADLSEKNRELTIEKIAAAQKAEIKLNSDAVILQLTGGASQKMDMLRAFLCK